MSNEQKVIVTGGAGFIGSHLVQALVDCDFEVHVIDNLSTGKREKVAHEAVFHEVDIRDLEAIRPLFTGVRYVFHTAALPRILPSIKDPRTSHDVNVTGTLNVLLAARDSGAARVIYSASSSAYGNHEVLPLYEELPARPMHPYGLQKYMGEQLMQLFTPLYSLPTVSLRYFNVYGSGAPVDGAYAQAIAIFFHLRKQGKPLTIVPDGEQTRDFTHVRDVVRANILAAESPHIRGGEVINIGAGRNYTVNEIARMIGGPTVFVEPRIEAKHSCADNTKAKNLLGWESSVPLEDGVAELKALHGLK